MVEIFILASLPNLVAGLLYLPLWEIFISEKFKR